MLFFILIGLLLYLSKSEDTCINNECPISNIGDTICNVACMFPECNYDSRFFLNDTFLTFQTSDCFSECFCDESKLTNGKCDPECSLAECGFDLGDCGYCATGCFLEDLQNILKVECQNNLCKISTQNDSNFYCAPGCSFQDFSLDECKEECKNKSCLDFIENPCSYQTCAPMCTLALIENNICDGFCNNFECNYDGGDCDCSIGCFDTSGECTTNKTNIDPCDTEKCNYKDGKCGFCGSGCFEENLGDGICQPQCNIQTCSYDYGDCGCAPGCTFKYDNTIDKFIQTGDSEECHDECLSLNCGFGVDFCTNKTLIEMAVLDFFLLQEFSFSSSFCEFSGCPAEEIKSYLAGNANCSGDEACYGIECFYCMGRAEKMFENCLRQSPEICLVCDSVMVEKTCYKDLSQCPNGYEYIEKLSSIFGNKNWCLIEAVHYSKSNYKEIFVDSTVLENGNGTKYSPSMTLYNALVNVYADYTKIYLVNRELEFYIDNSVSVFVTDIYDPLNILTSYEKFELWIIGNYSQSEKTTIYWKENLKISPIAHKFYMKNIELIGKYVMGNDCKYETCYYCPNLKHFSFISNDRGDFISNEDFYANYSKNCDKFFSVNVFDFSRDAFIENVSFENFRYQFNSLIKASGILNMKNVRFSKMQAKYEGSIIQLESGSKFTYIQGDVYDIGAGYNDVENVKTGSFLKAFDAENIFITNITFSYNFLYHNLRSSNKAYLIYSKNHIGTITIENCLFENNYINYLVYIDVKSLNYENLKIIKGKMAIYSEQHFLMKNIEIKSTYCSHGLINYSMLRVVHNIKLMNLSISDSVIAGDGILTFMNEKFLEKSDINGDYILYISGDFKYESDYIFYEARHLNLDTIIIKDSKIAKNSVKIFNFPNVLIKDFSIDRVSDGSENDIKNIISSFTNSGRYFSFIDTEYEVPILNCYEMVLVLNSINLFIDTLQISDILCPSQELTLGVSLYKLSGEVNITSLSLKNLQNKSKSGVALTIIDLKSISIYGLEIYNSTNFKESILSFDNCDQIIIDSALIYGVNSNYTSTFIVSNSKYFSLSNFVFKNMSTNYNNGGCLFLLTGNLGSSFKFFSGKFTGCSSNGSKGGAIFLDSISRSFSTLFQMDNINISECYSSEGAAIFISNNVNLYSLEESKLVQLLITDNYSKNGGTISDYHYSEKLTIDGLEMRRNNLGIYCFYSNENIELRIINSMIYAQDTSNSAIYLNNLALGSTIYLQNVDIYNSSKVALEAYSVKVFLDHVNIFDAYVAISFSDHLASISKSLKIVNTMKDVIKLENNCTFYCNFCEISKSSNFIVSSGSNSNFYFENSLFYLNTLNNRYLLSVNSGESKESYLINCQIYSNSLFLGSLIYLISSTLNIDNCTIIENEVFSTSVQTIYLFSSKMNILNSRFKLIGFVNYGSIFYAEAGSIISAENTIFENSQSLIGNIYGSNVNIKINNCTFFGNTGGDIYTTDSNLYITNSIFDNSLITNPFSGNIGIKNNNETIIRGSTFKNLKILPSGDGGVIQNHKIVKKESISDEPVNVLDSNIIAQIYDESSKKLNILNSTFIGTSDLVMAVYTKETKLVLVESSIFYGHNTFDSTLFFVSYREGLKASIINSKITRNLSNKNGGAIYSENYDLIIENTEISSNTAKNSGGGIYYKSPKCFNCGIYLIGKTKIFNNSCTDDGGAIKWENYKPLLEEGVLIYNNSAAYGSNLASTFTNFGPLKRRSVLDSNLTTLINITPGKRFTDNIQIFIYDTYGQIVTTENSIIATLSVNQSEDSIAAISGITNFKAVNGVFTITDFTLTGVPGSIVYLKLESDMISSGARNDETVYSDSIFIKVEFRDCASGEQIQATACIDCDIGKYTLRASKNCLSCPTGAICKGGNTIIVKNGYWRSSLESDVIYECGVFDACIKGSEINELGNCSTGYTGVLCKSCEIGYSKTANGICAKCPSKNTNYVTMVLLIFAMIFISFVLVKTSLTSAYSPKSLHSIYIKIFTNYLQLIFIVTQFDLEWPYYVTEFFNIQRSTASVSEQLFSFDCYIALKSDGDIQNVYYSKLIIISALPLVIAIISYLYWIIHGMVVESFKSLKREVYTTIIVLFFLAYQTIVKSMFSNFSCIEIDKMSSYLIDNTSIECWDLNHKKYSFIIALPSILLWTIGVPTILLLLITKNRRRLHHDYYRVVFGFLYNGYKQSRFYWEINIMYRKIILISITVFKITQARVIQALNLVLVLLVSIYLHHNYKPYNSSELNNMEMQALDVAAVTIYFGLYYISKYIGESIKILLFVLIVLGNSYFILYWIYYMSLALTDAFIKVFPRFRSIFKRGDAFDEEFYKEKLEREGVYFNKLEGEKAYTLIKTEKKNEEEEFKYRRIEEVYIAAAKRDIERTKIIEN